MISHNHRQLNLQQTHPCESGGIVGLRDRLEVTVWRAECLVRGHKWDSDRPSGPIHLRDICWRCDAVRDHRAS